MDVKLDDKVAVEVKLSICMPPANAGASGVGDSVSAADVAVKFGADAVCVVSA